MYDEGTSHTVTWFHGSNGPVSYRRLSKEAQEQPITPRVPDLVYQRPIVAALAVTAVGICGSWLIVTGMGNWPVWTIFPVMIGAVLSLAATVVGMGTLVVLALQPVIGSRSLNWDAEPLGVLGLPPNVQQKCESLGFWTCEAMVASIEQRRFPWTSLEYDERMQVERALSRWRAMTSARETDSV
jgi:hypothetical protein